MSWKDRRKRREKIIKDLATMSVDQVARKYGLSHDYISKIGKEAGVGKLVPPPKPSASTFKILKMLLDGERPCDICRHFGIKAQSVNHVKDRARKAGFVLPEVDTSKPPKTKPPSKPRKKREPPPPVIQTENFGSLTHEQLVELREQARLRRG